MSTADGKEEEKKPFGPAMVKAAVKIVCEEKGLEIPKDIDELAKFIVLEKGHDYGWWNICRKDDLPYIISSFLGEAVLAEKKTEKDDDDTAKVLVKIKDNVWQVDFQDFCKNGAADLRVEKLEKCEIKIDYEIKTFFSTKIENILKDFEEHKSNKEKQGLENAKKDNNMMQASTHISKNPEPQTTKPKKGRSFLDCSFGWGTGINCDDNRRQNCQLDNREFFYDVHYKRPFHACTDPKIYKEFQEKLGKRR